MRYYITEWDARYEVNDKNGRWKAGQAKRAGPLEYIRMKVHGHSAGLGWRRLIAVAGQRRAPSVFGVFGKLCELAGHAPGSQRGYVDDTEEMPLAFILELHPSDVGEALTVLTKIGWLKKEEESNKEEERNKTIQDKTRVREIPGNSRKSPETPPKRFQTPTAQQVSDYAKSIGFPLDGQVFVDSYTAKGWMIGKSPMKDWKAAVRTWKRRREIDHDSGTKNSHAHGRGARRDLSWADDDESIVVGDD